MKMRTSLFTSYATRSSGIPWNIARVTSILSRYTHSPKGSRDKCDISWYTTRACCNTILYHAIENKVVTKYNQCDIAAAHDGKVGCNTVEYTTAFLYSDWLYFLWHGINDCISLV